MRYVIRKYRGVPAVSDKLPLTIGRKNERQFNGLDERRSRGGAAILAGDLTKDTFSSLRMNTCISRDRRRVPGRRGASQIHTP